ncbi:hypothetical protein R3P38DRAFT_3625528 [Favolaschia claudopus]|uniref:Retrotransposon gag domain-containing protein n=1 Tax=Favolaschia claudopus TaxID=2862362 RepID=A0AAW0A145_9AGAR
MTQKSTDLFRGDCTAEKAQVWLRILEGTFTETMKDELKLYKFQRALYPGSAAEKWWKDLKDGDKSDFATLTKAFDAKWPMPQFISRPQTLVINEIKANKLPLHEVGRVVKDEDGVEVLSHQAWAQRTRKLLADIPSGDAGMLLMEHVRDGLPVALRRLIASETKLDSWEKWLAAVEAIDLHALNDVHEELGLPRSGVLENDSAWVSPSNAENEAALTDIAQRLGVTYMLSPQRTPPPPRRVTTPYTPAAARLSQPEFTSRPSQPRYNPPTYPSTPPQRGPPPHMLSSSFGGSATMRPGNIFAKHVLATPGSPSAGRGDPAGLSGDPARDAELARTLNSNPRLYGTDAASVQRYTADTTSWMTSPRNYALFPFSPGTVAPGSKECWNCGTLTSPPHGAGSCTSATRIPRIEYNIRR